MDKQYIMQAAETVRQQLLATTPMNVILSWGVKKFVAMEFRGMPALTFRVDGRLFKGTVVIALNGSDDYYEIYLHKYETSSAELLQDKVCFDEMGDIIDIRIERGTNKAEYDQFCKQESKKLVI